MESITLASGHAMPSLGLGTWQLGGRTCKPAVQKAIDLGYTHIDTAHAYGNQKMIGDALKEMGAHRSALFITSKIRHSALAYDDAIAQCDDCLNQLQTDYLDLLLIHWPTDDVPLEETLRAFNTLHEQGKVKSIGVSNFSARLIDQAKQLSDAPIAVNQIKYHPLHNPEELLEHCKQQDVVVTAYSPLGRGSALTNPTIRAIAKEQGKTPAQVALRWLLQKGMIVIPKASSEAHLKENMDVFGWKLSQDEMQRMDALAG